MRAKKTTTKKQRQVAHVCIWLSKHQLLVCVSYLCDITGYTLSAECLLSEWRKENHCFSTIKSCITYLLWLFIASILSVWWTLIINLRVLKDLQRLQNTFSPAIFVSIMEQNECEMLGEAQKKIAPKFKWVSVCWWVITPPVMGGWCSWALNKEWELNLPEWEGELALVFLQVLPVSLGFYGEEGMEGWRGGGVEVWGVVCWSDASFTNQAWLLPLNGERWWGKKIAMKQCGIWPSEAKSGQRFKKKEEK